MFEEKRIGEEEWKAVPEVAVIAELQTCRKNPLNSLSVLREYPMSTERTPWAEYRWNPDRKS